MLFKEISKGVGTKCIPVSDEEVEEAKKIYLELLNLIEKSDAKDSNYS